MPNTVFNNVRIVLVNTTHPGNIGAVARAMKNMGLSRLYLVNPKTFPSPEAEWRAAGAVDLLEKATVVHSLEEAILPCALVVGTSARKRHIPWPMLNARDCARQVMLEPSVHEVAILFGQEAMGLTNEELQMCHVHLTIPTDESYSALNIAAAVQVVCYELQMAWLESQELQHQEDKCQGRVWDLRASTAAEMESLFQHLERTLIQLDFLKPENPRQLMTRLRRLFLRARLDEMEMNILRGILTNVEQLKACSTK